MLPKWLAWWLPIEHMVYLRSVQLIDLLIQYNINYAMLFQSDRNICNGIHLRFAILSILNIVTLMQLYAIKPIRRKIVMVV